MGETRVEDGESGKRVTGRNVNEVLVLNVRTLKREGRRTCREGVYGRRSVNKVSVEKAHRRDRWVKP